MKLGYLNNLRNKRTFTELFKKQLRYCFTIIGIFKTGRSKRFATISKMNSDFADCNTLIESQINRDGLVFFFDPSDPSFMTF